MHLPLSESTVVPKLKQMRKPRRTTSPSRAIFTCVQAKTTAFLLNPVHLKKLLTLHEEEEETEDREEKCMYRH